MNHYQKLAEQIYAEMLSLKCQCDHVEDIEHAEEMIRKNRIAVIRVAIMNHDNKLKVAIFKNVTAFLLGFIGKREKDIEISIHTCIMRTTAEGKNDNYIYGGITKSQYQELMEPDELIAEFERRDENIQGV